MKQFLLTIFVFCLYQCQNATTTFPVELEPIINLGRISAENYNEFNICVKNTSNNDVKIRYIQTGCGCLSASNEVINVNIHANDSLNIQFKYKPTSIGYVERDIYFYLKDYKIPIKVCVKGFAKN